jgi:ATP-dependent DNA helicase RecG
VVDEQHRFGVRERLALTGKGDAVDVLVLSATPLPRTLVLTYFGDMDISELREKPAGRQEIVTRAIPDHRLAEVIDAVGRAREGGKRVYWICPLVEESENTDAKLTDATARFESLQERFGDRVGLVHGRMRGPEKDAVMADFASGALGLLVATTVVEVGVDVPEASIMIIEQAERFGLAALHQLRGRVGRGDAQSFCLLMPSSELNEGEKRRLAVLRDTEDGFVIADADFRLRGGGEALGTRQSGAPVFRLGLPEAEAQDGLVTMANRDAAVLLEKDPPLTGPRGQAIRLLLRLFGKEAAMETLRAG